jgi:hypothetical protein
MKMFANTITLTVGVTARILNRINQDAYGSEYSLLLTDREISLKFRHQKETAKNAVTGIDRHNVTVTEKVYGVPGVSNEVVREASFTIRNMRFDDKALAEDAATSAVLWLTPANVLSLINWES